MKLRLFFAIPILVLMACGGNGSPEETADLFFKSLQEDDMEVARELVAQDRWDELEDFCYGKEIVNYTIENVEISDDGNSALVEWSTVIVDEYSRDTNEGDEFELEMNDDSNWIITAL